MSNYLDKYIEEASKKATNNLHVPQIVTTYLPKPDMVYAGRLIGYIEKGIHPNTYSKQTNDRNILQLDFEISVLHDDDELASMRDSEGRLPVKSKYLTLSYNEKSSLFKLGNSMDPNKKYDQLYQMLNEVFLLEIDYILDKNTNTKTSYTIKNIKYPIAPIFDSVSKKTKMIDQSDAAAPLSRELRCFIWNHPSIEAWDSLFIPGEFNNESRNFVQNNIREAINFENSPIYNLLVEAERDPYTDYDEEGHIIYKHNIKK